MNEKLKEKVKESLSSVLPITLIVLVLSVTLVPMEIGTLALFLTGAVLLIVGMGFFQLGAEMSMTPLGEGVGKTLAKREKVLLVVLVAFALGTIITIAEPDLQVLAETVPHISSTRSRRSRTMCSSGRSPSAWASFWRWPCCAFCFASRWQNVCWPRMRCCLC